MVMAAKKAVGAEYDYGYQYSQAEKRKKQRVIGRKNRASLAIVVTSCTMLITALFLTGLGYTFLQARLACLNWQLQKIEQENLALASNIEKARLQIAELKALNRIEDIAVTQLGMIKDPGIEYLVMNEVAKEAVVATAAGNEEIKQATEKDQPMKMAAVTDREKNGDSLFTKLYLMIAQSVGEKG